MNVTKKHKVTSSGLIESLHIHVFIIKRMLPKR